MPAPRIVIGAGFFFVGRVLEQVEFRVLQLVGVVYQADNGDYHIVDEDHGDKNVLDELRTMVGGEVEVVAAHAPSDPPQRERWGGGCCMWELSGKCSAGHHDRPGYLYEVHAVGTLVEADGKWHIAREGKDDLPIYLTMLNGHRCRIAVVPKVDLNEILEDAKNVDANNLSDLMARAENLRNFISQAEALGKNKP